MEVSSGNLMITRAERRKERVDAVREAVASALRSDAGEVPLFEVYHTGTGVRVTSLLWHDRLKTPRQSGESVAQS